MKRLISFIFVLAWFWQVGQAQNPKGGGIPQVVTLPSVCQTNNVANNFVFVTSGSVGPYYCNPSNTYNALTGGTVNAAFASLTTGSNTTATMTVGSGASLVRTGSGIIDANKILGTTLTSLTGIIKMASGIPSVAAAGTDYQSPIVCSNDTNLTCSVSGATLTLAWASTLAAARMVNAGVHTGDAAGTFPAVTLATVNSNVGTFGDSTHVAQVTVNGKGLVTAASSVAISGGGTGCTTSGSANGILVDDGAGGCTTSTVTIDPTAGLAGGVSMPQGTAKAAPANTVLIQAPAAVTAYSRVLPGAVGSTGIVHETVSGSTQTETVSTVVAADIASATITGTQIASSIALAGNPTTTTQPAKTNSTAIATTAYVDRPTGLTAATSITLAAPRQYFVCTSTCTVTVPAPAAGYEFCVRNGNNVSTVITLAAIGSSAMYENTASTAYGTAGTGTFVSGGAVGDKVCIVGLDSTHYLTFSYAGTWTAS